MAVNTEKIGTARNAAEICLKETVVRPCPECLAEITLEGGKTYDCEIRTCPDCGIELEVMFFNRDDPADVKRVIETIKKQGSKKGEKLYDVSHLDMTQSPVLGPAPQEDEDWGQ